MHLFEPVTFRAVTLRNRIAVSPMCQYSSRDGHPTPWHMVHLGSRAVGGAGLVMVEATAVEARGRISPDDSGLWLDSHAEAYAPIARFLTEQGAVPAVQLAHAGRKASTAAPWKGGKGLPPDQGGWSTIAPSPIAFAPDYPMPTAMTSAEIDDVVKAFGDAASRAVSAGFEVLEIHAAHGYLLHQFLSPLSNHRDDEYGGSLESRSRFLRRVIAEVRRTVPDSMPIFLRLSATDWAPTGGWDLEQSCALIDTIKHDGIDLVDTSTGGLLANARVPIGPSYQVPFAAEIRRRTNVPTGAVGQITSPEQADSIIRTQQADIVLLARELLRDPYWPRRAAAALGVKIEAPLQYGRAWT